MAYDPYATPEYNERGDALNGYSGSKTSGSMMNAGLQRTPKMGGGGNVFAEMVQYGRQPMGVTTKRQPAAMAPATPSIAGYGTAGVQRANPFAQPFDNPWLLESKQSNPGLRGGGGEGSMPGRASGYVGGGSGESSFPARAPGYVGNMPAGYGDGQRSGANPFATPAQLPGQARPVPPGMTRVFGEPTATPQGGALSGYGTGAPTGGEVQGGNPFGGSSWQPFNTGNNPNAPGGGGMGAMQPSVADIGYGPGVVPNFNGNPPNGSGGGTLADRLQVFDNPYFTEMAAGGNGPFAPNPDDPRPGGINPSTPRPPATPSTQPMPNPRPPATPSTQPAPNPFASSGGRDITYADPRTGGTTHTQPSPFTVPFNSAGPRWIDEPGPMDSGRDPSGMSATPAQQYAPNGLPLGTNGVGRRLTPAEDPTTASGRANVSYQWFKKPDGTNEFWQVDANGQPVARASSGMNGPVGNQTAIPWGATAPTQSGGSTSTTTTSGGQTSAPNNSTTFDPNVLPSSNVGSWLDPVMNDTMDRLARQLRHEGSLTGATNSGGFIPGMTEALAPVANQFAAQKGQLMYQDQQAKADRLLDKYKFDNTQQLQQWIETNKNELEKYGIDQNVLLGRYNADAGVKAAGIGASASSSAARYGADASKYNSLLDYLSSTYGTDANYNLGMGNLGLGFFNAGNQYNLGLYGADIDRENNMMNYLSRIYGLGPDFLRLLAGSDPSQLIPGMSPGNTVTVR